MKSTKETTSFTGALLLQLKSCSRHLALITELGVEIHQNIFYSFLSTLQIIQLGIICLMILTPLPTFQKFQLLTASLILWGCVQLRPNTDRNMCQRIAATGQCKKRWLIDFKLSTHNIHSQAEISST